MILFTLTVTLLASSVICKCPEDPLDCLIKWRATASSDQQQLSNIIHEDHLEPFDDLTPSSSSSDHQSTDGTFTLNDTQAAGCGENQTLSSDKVCKKCSKCPKNGIQLRSCNSTHDTRCSCEKGSYLSVLDYECKPCSSCPYGQVYKKCTRYRDTKCAQCPPGSFFGVVLNQMGCIRCSVCQPHEIMLQECTRSQNTVCVDGSITRKNHLPIATPKDDSHMSPVIYHDSASLHVYFAVLVVIICCVIFYVVLKLRLKKMTTKSGQFYTGKSFRCPSNVYSPLPQAYHSFRVKNQGIQPLRGGLIMDSAFKVTTEMSATPIQTTTDAVNGSRANTKYSDIASTKKRALEASLNCARDDSRDWKCLGKQLDFCQEEIQGFACLGEDQSNPTRFLLQAWSKREGKKATVASLVMALMKVGRLDSAFILDPNCIRSPTASGFFL